MIDMLKYTERARVDGDYIVTGYNDSEKKLFKTVYPSYELGYVIGSYLSVGSVNIITYKKSTRGIVFWYVEKIDSQDKISKLQESTKKSFNLSITKRDQKKSSTYQLVCYSKPLATFFSTMGKKGGSKKLPEEYLFFDNENYKRGLIDGIEDFHGHVPDSRDVLKKRKVNLDVVHLYRMLTGY